MRYPKYRIVSKLVKKENCNFITNGFGCIDLIEKFDIQKKSGLFSQWATVSQWTDFGDMESAKSVIMHQIKLDSYQSKIWEADEKNVLAEEIK